MSQPAPTWPKPLRPLRPHTHSIILTGHPLVLSSPPIPHLPSTPSFNGPLSLVHHPLINSPLISSFLHPPFRHPPALTTSSSILRPPDSSVPSFHLFTCHHFIPTHCPPPVTSSLVQPMSPNPIFCSFLLHSSLALSDDVVCSPLITSFLIHSL